MVNMTTGDLEAFAEAFNRHDLDAIMAMMTDDCVFDASSGAERFGTRHSGAAAVRAAFAAVFAAATDSRWESARHFVSGDRGLSEWIYRGTRADGKRIEVAGCDVFTFRDGRIAVKNSFRKDRPDLSARA
jgi:steroid delta-isomerase-like uncharacterized protein